MNELTENMPEVQKQQLQQSINKMPKAKQEQLIAELIAKSKHRESLTEAERRAEDEETMKITTNFNHLLSQMDAQ